MRAVRFVPARTFNFIGKPKHQAGFFAHEVAEGGASWAVIGRKDEVDSAGNPVYQQLDYVSLVPTLWSALRNVDARLADVEARLMEKKEEQ